MQVYLILLFIYEIFLLKQAIIDLIYYTHTYALLCAPYWYTYVVNVCLNVGNVLTADLTIRCGKYLIVTHNLHCLYFNVSNYNVYLYQNTQNLEDCGILIL